MKKRILSGWNGLRIMYLLFGAMIIIPSIIQHEWAGLLVGIYFAAMGLFALGCAGGNCYLPSSRNNIPGDTGSVKYKEVKPIQDGND